MAKKVECVKCEVPKDAVEGYYSSPLRKDGRDRTCRKCRGKMAVARLEKRKAAGEKLWDNKGRYIKRKTDASGNYPERKTYGQDFAKRHNPTPTEIAHDTWLIRSQAFFDKFFSNPGDRRNCVRCPRECRHSLKDIVDSDYY